MRKCYVLLGIKMAEASLAISVFWCIADWRSGVTRENVYRLRPGMSWKQVEGILGRPGDHVSTCSSTFATVEQLRGTHGECAFTAYWLAGDASLQAQFDGQGKLIRAHLFNRDADQLHWAASTDDSLIEKSCKSLGLTHKNGSARFGP
jgi:hypothetical protein